MASEAPAPTRAPLWRRILKWIGIAILSLVALVAVVLLGINTDPGHRFLADQIGGYTTASGLNIRVGRIDGSIYGRMTLRDVRVNDPRGTFATAPELAIDWRPFSYIHKHIDVRAIEAGLVTLERNPQLKPTPPSTDKNAPLLPDIDLDVNRLRVDRLVLEAPVAGARHIARIDGSAHIADRRAQLAVNARALTAPAVAGGEPAETPFRPFFWSPASASASLKPLEFSPVIGTRRVPLSLSAWMAPYSPACAQMPSTSGCAARAFAVSC